LELHARDGGHPSDALAVTLIVPETVACCVGTVMVDDRRDWYRRARIAAVSFDG